MEVHGCAAFVGSNSAYFRQSKLICYRLEQTDWAHYSDSDGQNQKIYSTHSSRQQDQLLLTNMLACPTTQIQPQQMSNLWGSNHQGEALSSNCSFWWHCEGRYKHFFDCENWKALCLRQSWRVLPLHQIQDRSIRPHLNSKSNSPLSTLSCQVPISFWSANLRVSSFYSPWLVLLQTYHFTFRPTYYPSLSLIILINYNYAPV